MYWVFGFRFAGGGGWRLHLPGPDRRAAEMRGPQCMQPSRFWSHYLYGDCVRRVVASRLLLSGVFSWLQFWGSERLQRREKTQVGFFFFFFRPWHKLIYHSASMLVGGGSVAQYRAAACGTTPGDLPKSGSWPFCVNGGRQSAMIYLPSSLQQRGPWRRIRPST